MVSAIWASRTAWIVAGVAIVVQFQRHELFAVGAAGIAIQAAAALLWIWARITFGRRSFHGSADPTAGGLVTRGPYRLLRHPIYASLIYFVWAGAMSHVSWPGLSAAAVCTIALAARMGSEEEFLARQYAEYADYARRTRRLIPWVL